MNRVNVKLFDQKDSSHFSEKYVMYHTIRNWLIYNKIDFRFNWIDTGNYFPSSIDLPHSDAIMLKLKYGL